jgi:hypothetical protein
MQIAENTRLPAARPWDWWFSAANMVLFGRSLALHNQIELWTQ